MDVFGLLSERPAPTLGNCVRERPSFSGLASYLVRRFMPMHIRRCVECPKCFTRYLIGFSPYRNGACLVPAAHGSFDEYTLYCSCCHPSATSQWNWSDLKAFAVARPAHKRGFGSCAEIVPLGERRPPLPAGPNQARFPRRKISS